jgi:plasmid stability protein
MVAVTLKNIPNELYERVKLNAKANHRSINNELIAIIEQSVMPQPLDIQAWLDKARHLRELTAHYVISDEALTRLKNEGRE